MIWLDYLNATETQSLINIKNIEHIEHLKAIAIQFEKRGNCSFAKLIL
ncbi:MAG: hypothetical protein RLZZ381_717 [Cyanobacteriota bacterium]|jgi:hypothetical protein